MKIDSDKIIRDLNIIKECREEFHVGLWQCPQFLFIVMGGITILGSLVAYYMGTQYAEPEVAVLITLGVTAIIFSIGHVVVVNFAHIAQVNRAKSEFVSVASHQLRTPLSSIKWTLGLLFSGRLGRVDETQLPYFQILRDGTQRMIDLVNDLLDVNRIELGRFTLGPEKISLAETVKGVIEDLSLFAKANNVEVVFQDTSASSLVMADPHRARMVVQNLVDNAIKYTKGKGTVEITIENEDTSVKCSVRDRGVGIPADQQKRVFKRFFRADNVLRYQTEGTGLGLYIVKSIVEMSGGRVGFTSKEHKGSIFWFTLPLIK